MSVSNIQQFQLRRINPFQGLMINADIWRDAHDYHREHTRLHNLALHGTGIVQGLEVSVQGIDNTLLIEPGVAVDPRGNVVVVSEQHEYRVTAQEAGTIFIVIQFREVLAGPTQLAPDGIGQPTRVRDAFRIVETFRLPDEPFLELARIAFEPERGPISLPADPGNPAPNELDIRHRRYLATGGTATLGAEPEIESDSATPAVLPGFPAGLNVTAPPSALASPVLVAVGMGLHDGAGWDSHRQGLGFLTREVEVTSGRRARVLEGHMAIMDQIDLLYLTGHARLSLDDGQLGGLNRVIDQGGLVVGEGCVNGPNGEEGAREFAISFVELANRMGKPLSRVGRGHPILTSRHVFAEPPTGARKSSRVLEGGGLVYCDADYGCAWQGGTTDYPMSRAMIRDAMEFGVNLALYRRAPH